MERCRKGDCQRNARRTANIFSPSAIGSESNLTRNNQNGVSGNRAPNNGYDCRGNLRSNNENSRSNSLLHRLQALDFSIVDTVLYLDAYPDCHEALSYYHKLVSERDALLRTLSEQHSMPTTNYENASRDRWDWINNPWPWEYGAN